MDERNPTRTDPFALLYLIALAFLGSAGLTLALVALKLAGRLPIGWGWALFPSLVHAVASAIALAIFGVAAARRR